MKALRFALLALARDWKSGELAVLLLALLVAVSALTAVGFFTSRVNRAVAQQAGEVLAADLRLQSGRSVDPAYLTEARRRGLETAELIWFPSVVFVGEQSSLANVRGVSAGYPLRGRLKVADRPFGPPRVTDSIPEPGTAWLDSRLLARLGAGVGDRVSLGAIELEVAQVLDYRPDQGSQFVDLAPTLLLNMADVGRSQLVQPGSRVFHAALFAGDPAVIGDFRDYLAERKAPAERLIDVSEASPQIRSSIDRAGRFLNLAALVTVILSAVAVAMAARRYAYRHTDTVALMKTLGAAQGLVLGITMMELVLLGVSAAIVGTGVGYLAQEGLAWLLRDLLASELPGPALSATGLGLVTALAVLIGFALPPLMQLRRVPPARVLRKDLEPPPLAYSLVYGLATAAVIAMALWVMRDLRLVGYVTLGAALTFAVLLLAGWVLVQLTSRLRGNVGVAWRYGLSNIARRGRGSVVQVVAFGLGLMVLLLLAVVRNDLLDDWRASLPEGAPNHFLINIRPDERQALPDFFVERGIEAPVLVPMVRARISHINSVPVQDVQFDNDRARGFVEREANLTWSEKLRDDNRLVRGTWWTGGDAGELQVSVEQDIGADLGLELGDVLTYDVAGETLAATVTSFREVEWDSFQPNFFMVLSPGALQAATGTYITSVHLDAEQRPLLIDLVRRFPEVTIIDIDAILAQVRQVMDRASLAVQYVFLFTILAGLTVLLAAIQATGDERRYESAMLRTLGASRRVVLQGVAAEFTALGLIAGSLAALGATTAGYLLAEQVFSLEYTLDPLVWLTGLLTGALLVGVSGTMATRSVVTHPPVSTLREG